MEKALAYRPGSIGIMKQFKIFLLWTVLIGFFLILPKETHAETKTITIQNGQFTPQITIISPGDTVTWINRDSIPHTATSDEQTGTEAWDSGILTQDKAYSKSFTVPGTYTYHCAPHPNMVAVVQVGTQVTIPTPSSADPSPSSAAGSASLDLTLFLNGIGKAGDSLRKNGDSPAPTKSQRPVSISFIDASGLLIKMIQTTANYAAATGNFTGTATIDELVQGNYQVKIKADGFLESASQMVTITAGQKVTIPPLYLVNGDTNNDNQLNTLDYNSLLNCFESKMYTCQEGKAADINDDGAVNGFDYNLFLRELSAISKI